MKTAMSIKEISSKLKTVSEPEDSFLKECQEDGRKGVTDLVSKWQRAYEKELQVKNNFMKMTEFERELRKQGFSVLAGIDEVGRGPLAGPVVTSAVILPESFYLPGLNDSKKIPESKRELFYETILKEAVSIGVGIVHSEEIDEINIYQATKKAMIAAVNNLSELPDHLLIDAMELEVPIPQLSLIKGDARSISISAASIIAKVTRDRMMKGYGEAYPEYGFEKHMGYGTKLHLEALDNHGLTPWHRRSFTPVKEIAARTND
ncbi:ribonuclease HII [Peribacillus sp. TH16]|uniref:ribonuclease HII n=1 Tax=Peribacillus sp. TH16 TaxID=2798482 RepID=UPI001911B816|nr:ribonuclease HII [Peribacillus sp. TH16]MBK5481203.1 ribonuclease HII [Peribacillus sp. TH16]